MPIANNVREHVQSITLSLSEQVLACCTIAREKLEKGDYDAGCAALAAWWKLGEWPQHHGLSNRAAAELLLTAGTLSSWVASTRQGYGDQKCAEALLNGAIALFQQLDEHTRADECRIELAGCYYREGCFDLSRTTLRSTLRSLDEDQRELRADALIRLASVERHVGHLHDALNLLNETSSIAEGTRPWIQARLHSEFANTLKELGIAENRAQYFDRALGHHRECLLQLEKIANSRFVAVVHNNLGYLLLTLQRLEEADDHLQQARNLFHNLADSVACAQVDETIARLHLASKQYEWAERSIKLAVETLESSGEEALLAEALTTQGLVLCKLGRRHESKPILHRARRAAERCGDDEGAGRPLLILIEEMCDQLSDDERREIGAHATQLLANSQQASTRERLKNCLDRIAAAHAEHEQQRERAVHAEKMAALGELSFGVAHNVNNTLTGILGRAQLLLRTTDPMKMAAGLDLIIKSAEDGAQIIRRIQDFARQRPCREFEPVSVSQLLKDACEMARPRWETRPTGAAINFALLADCSAFVMGDAVELREVLVNVIYNAVDAMPNGGELKLSAQEVAERVTITIADTGTGMRPEVKSRLFDPFFTTKGKAGTGMGLAVSFGIIRRHEGAIEVDSEPGRGTAFKITLPRATNIHAITAKKDVAHAGIRTAEGVVRALVVDDETVIREVLTEALEAEGCEVVQAESGEQALEFYDGQRGQFDVIFTDIGMPDMNGWALINAVRERSATIPVAIVSGWADAIGWDKRNASKAEWVIAKPFDIAKISEIAKEITSRKRSN